MIPTKRLSANRTAIVVTMSLITATNFQYEPGFINVSKLKELIEQMSIKPFKEENCDNRIDYCPNCGQKTRKTLIRKRIVHYLQKSIKFVIHYYYCDNCSKGWPSIPPNALPNIHCGIDVLGHISYWHIFKGESFETLKEHLRDCHGIITSITTIRLYTERFSILIENGLRVMDLFIADWFQEQSIKQGLFDETFFTSRLGPKICVGTFFLPEVRVIAGINILEKRNHEIITNVMNQFKDSFGELDVLTVDMSVSYKKPAEIVFTSLSLQFCVFHFFQMLHRSVFNPFMTELFKEVKQDISSTRGECKKIIKKVKDILPGHLGELLVQLQERILWCLKKRNIVVLVEEIHFLKLELNKQLNEIPINSMKDSFMLEMRIMTVKTFNQINSQLEKLERKIKQHPSIVEANTLASIHIILQKLFEQTDEDHFLYYEKILFQKIEETPYETVNEIAEKYNHYRENLSTYLDKGVERTTSLLERVHQSMKKVTSHNRGAHSETEMELYMSLYKFFWNTSPIQLPDESSSDKLSPIGRIMKNTNDGEVIDIDYPWYTWMMNIEYYVYRNKVKELNLKKKINQKVLPIKKDFSSLGDIYTVNQKAQLRWEQSNTLKNLGQELNNIFQPPVNAIELGDPAIPLNSTNFYIYNLLSSYSDGLTRAEIVKLSKLPRSTIYDSLHKLEVNRMITSYKRSNHKRGRSPVVFCIRDPPKNAG